MLSVYILDAVEDLAVEQCDAAFPLWRYRTLGTRRGANASGSHLRRIGAVCHVQVILEQVVEHRGLLLTHFDRIVEELQMPSRRTLSTFA